MSVRSKVEKVFADHLDNNVSDNDTLDELCLDSLDRIGILMDIEAELDIEADDNESRLWLTVGDVINYFENNRS